MRLHDVFVNLHVLQKKLFGWTLKSYFQCENFITVSNERPF